MKITPLSILFATTFLSTSAIALSLEPTLDNSVISYSESTSTDYNFTIQEADSEGNLTTKYYKIVLNKDDFSTASSISWTEVTSSGTNTIEVNLPNNQVKYFKYSYSASNGYSTTSARINDSLSTSYTTDTVFSGIISTANGGAIYNTANSYNINIKSDFIENSLNSYESKGGAVYNHENGAIGDIIGNFLGNHVNGYDGNGGSVYNDGAISDITGDFMGNYANSYYGNGGAIYNNESGTIGNIIGNFLGNYTYSYYGYGGAIYNSGTINDITGDFIGNYVDSSDVYAHGGAIYNIGEISDITGDFIGNYADNYGGAIYNDNGGIIAGITGDFVGNYTSIWGAAIYNDGRIDYIIGDFIDNYTNHQGAAIYNRSTLGDITGDFIGNYTKYNGGAIYNLTNGLIGDIKGDFIENHVISSEGIGYGGAIYNQGIIGNITGDFVGNYGENPDGEGGAIYNFETIGNISGTFINNHINGIGGAIYNNGSINDLSGDFISNHSTISGGGVRNYYNGTISSITGNFIGNYVDSSNSHTYGGAIDNSGIIGDITGNFEENHIISSDVGAMVYGGAVFNDSGTIGNITGNFTDNYAEGDDARGGAILSYGKIESITGDFVENHVKGNHARGGAIYITGGHDTYDISSINGSFLNNYAKITSQSAFALGGAIFLETGELDFIAAGSANLFSGNYAEDTNGNKINNAIFACSNTEGASILNFKLKDNGSFVFDDEIDGGYVKILYNDSGSVVGEEIITDGYGYNLNISGDTYNTSAMDETNTIRFNDKVNNVYDFSLDSVQMALGKNAVINIVRNYVAKNNPYLRLDLDAVNREVGLINIGGDVEGTTPVIVNVLQYKETAKEDSIVFAIAKNHNLSDEKAQKSFEVYRVIGSPYMWAINYDTTEKEWGLYSTDEENPDEEDDTVVPTPDTPDTPSQPSGPTEVAPEIIGFETLPNAGLAQTNGMVYNIMRKVGINHLYCPGCGFYDYNWDGEPFHNVWVDTTYNSLTIEAPVEIEAKVWGIEAGADIQKDSHSKLGIFVSYRQGNYEMDGKGEKYFSKVGSELDIDSYLAGLYYRYDKNNWYAFATLYGGMQEAEIKTDDGVSVDTDGIEFGGSAEVGYSYALNKTVYVTPSLGVFYSQINYDDASDNYGKTVEYDDLRQVELEAGIKFSKAEYIEDGFYAVYLKPSVVKTLIDGDEIDISKLGKVNTIEDKTLGRVEIGVNYGFTNDWSAYGWGNYTFGSDYEAISLGAGVNYSW